MSYDAHQKAIRDKALEDALQVLGEHFEAVQILATWDDIEGTDRTFIGVGNYYARLGMAHEFIESDKAKDSAIEIAKRIQLDPPDEGEAWKG